MTTRLLMIAALALAHPLLGLPNKAKAQLRIVSWNTATGTSSPGYGGRQSDFNNVLDFIGREEVNGVAKPIDVLVLQEQSDNTNSLASFAAELNTITGTSNYVAWSQDPFGTDGLDTGFVYNSATVTPFLEDWFGTGSSRASSRIGLRPVDYTNASLYIYNTHHSAVSLVERRDEAFDIRIQGSSGSTNSGNSGVSFGSDMLASDANVIYAGDFNQDSSTEDASSTFSFDENPYNIMTLGPADFFGSGQGVDPIGAPGTWHNNSSFASIHTQSPHNNSFGLVTGGMDDRFDFQMVSTELNDGEGLSYIGPNAGDSTASSASYHTFGNNGTTYNTHAGTSGNSGLDWIITQGETLPGLTATQTRNAVRTSLARASDHSPVVVDYQLPSSLDATVGTVPGSVAQGVPIDLTVTVTNVAAVLASVGADELDYTLTVSGDLAGGATGVDVALGGGNDHFVSLDTSTPGAKSGTITVSSSSQDAENALISIPVSFTVVGGVLGDFNGDLVVDEADIDLLRANQGTVPPIDAKFDLNSDANSDFVVSGDQNNPLLLSDSDILTRSILGTEYGDADLNGHVDLLDFGALSSNFGSGSLWSQGNFNGDAVVDLLDFGFLSANFGFSAPSAADTASPAPEPGMLGLSLVGVAVACRRRPGRKASNRSGAFRVRQDHERH